jgi:hypothetical protein
MTRIARRLTFALVVVALFLLGAGRTTAQTVFVSSPGMSCYYPAPTVSYYSPPVYYTPAPAVSYYYTPAVSYYAPAVSYYAAPVGVTTTRYGLFGRPRVTTYYPSVYMGR